MLDSLERSIESNPHLPHVPPHEPRESRILSAVENHTMGYNPQSPLAPNPVVPDPVSIDPNPSPPGATKYNPFQEKVFVDPAVADDRFRHGSFPSPKVEGYAWKEQRIFYREPPVPKPRLGSTPKMRLSDDKSMTYCPKRKEHVKIEKVCKKCPEYDPNLGIYDNCKLKKKQANKLAKASRK